MSLFKQFETVTEKEVNGVPVQFPPNEDGSIPTFILAATSKANVRYTKALRAATKPWRANMDAIGDENAERIYKDVFVKHVLKGWSNVKYDDGTEIPFSHSEAIKLFERLPRLYDALTLKANSVELFRDQQLEDDAGN